MSENAPVFEPLTVAAQSFNPPRSRTTVFRWVRQYPALGLRLGHRCFFRRDARELIAQGMPLHEAAQRVGASGGRAA